MAVVRQGVGDKRPRLSRVLAEHPLCDPEEVAYIGTT